MEHGLDYVVDMVCVPVGLTCSKYAMILAGTFTGDIMTILGITSTGMVIIVNMDKFIEKVIKYSLAIKLQFIILKERFLQWKNKSKKKN